MLKCNKYQRRYKGKWITEAVYKHRLKKSEAGKKLKRFPQLNSTEKSVPEIVKHSPEEISVSSIPVAETSIATDETIQDTDENFDNNRELDYMEGRRIVEFSVLAKQMWCAYCKEALSLENIEQETRRGLVSILQVRCHKCLLLNIVNTGKKHSSLDGSMNRFDVNSKIVLGIMYAGMGWIHLNKILSCLNIPTISFSTFKRYEKEIGPLVEKVAKESCAKAAALERSLTIKDAAVIEKLL